MNCDAKQIDGKWGGIGECEAVGRGRREMDCGGCEFQLKRKTAQASDNVNRPQQRSQRF